MSALQSDDPTCDNDVVFGNLPTLDQVVEVPEREAAQLPKHIEYLKSKLKQQQRRKQIIAEQDRRSREMRALLDHTRAQSRETEKLNTQAAVLLTALTRLQRELGADTSQHGVLLSEISGLKQQSESLLTSLRISQRDADELKKATSVRHDNAGKLMRQLQSLFAEGRRFQGDSQATTQRISELLKESEGHNRDLAESSANFRDLGEQAKHVIELAGSSLAESEQQAEALRELLQSNQDSGDSLLELADSLQGLQAEMRQERSEQDQLNERSRTQLSELENLAQQQTALIDHGNSRVQDLQQELEAARQNNKRYQSQLRASDEKLQEALQYQMDYQAQYDNALTQLESNKTALLDAADSLRESNQHGERFNEAMLLFHQSHEQSQQLILRSQHSLENLLSRNQSLEDNNRHLAERLHAGNAPSPVSELDTVDELKLSELNPDLEQHVGDRDGFYKLMIVLAIMLPLSFIAHSVITLWGEERSVPANAGYESPFQLEEGSLGGTIDSPVVLPNTAAAPLLAEDMRQ